MMPLKTAITPITFRVRQQKNHQQQKTRQGDVTIVGMKALDRHIERLEAKLLFLIRSYDDPRTDLLYQYDKKSLLSNKTLMMQWNRDDVK